jgi:hypothetical protein
MSKPDARIKHTIYKDRSPEGVCILAGLVGYEIDPDGLELLTTEQRRELEVWAERTHLRASDNPVRLPPKPAWLPAKPWDGPWLGPENDDVFGGPTATPVDCAAVANGTQVSPKGE